MRKTRLAAIDVGTTKVCTIMADSGGTSGLRILGVGIAPSEGMHKGMVVDVNVAKNSIRQSVALAERTAGYRLQSANVGITGRHITSANRQGAIAITRQDQLVRPADLKRVLDAAKSIQIPGENKLLHVIPRTYKVGDQEAVTNPVGMHGPRLDVETHVISAAITSIQNLTKCVRGVGVEVDNLVLEPLASAEAVLTQEEKQKGVIVADIGGGTTDVAVYKDDTVYHTAVIPVAGYQVTRDISVGLDLSFELAEEIKKKYGDVRPVDGRKRPDDAMLNYKGQNIPSEDLSDIIRIRIEELMRLIVLEMPQSGLSKLVPAGLVLTGGGASLPGIAELAEGVTRLPVRVGVPFGMEGVSDSLQNPAYATGVGLLLWQLSQSGKQSEEVKRAGGIKTLVNRLLQLFR
ncbi:MAG: cell division protein FtsA [Chloroflexi bacterium]|nr:cell division protein FtsA [Chloroflexota bacterium]